MALGALFGTSSVEAELHDAYRRVLHTGGQRPRGWKLGHVRDVFWGVLREQAEARDVDDDKLLPEAKEAMRRVLVDAGRPDLWDALDEAEFD